MDALARQERLIEALCRQLQGVEQSVTAGRNSESADTSDIRAFVAAEVERLDGYLVYHVGELRRELAELRGSATPASHSISIGPDVDVLVVADEFDFVIPGREEGLIAFLLRHPVAAIEPGVRRVLAETIAPGDIVVDVGANIGLHSLAMARAVGPTGRVVCFEPIAHLAAALRRTLRLNGFGDCAEVHATAVAAATGRTQIFAASHSPISSLFPLAAGSHAEVTEVDVTTLDDAFKPGDRVDVMKIDVEGAEPRVWRGMKRLLAENTRLTIVLEWSASHFARAGERASEFHREIEADGFSISVIEDERPGHTTPLSAQKATTLEAGNVVLRRG